MSDDERSEISLYVVWKNPYTNKEEAETAYAPDHVVTEALTEYLKQFNIEFKDLNDFKRLLDDIDISYGTLEESDSFMEICKKLYYQSEEYKQDVAEWLDNYEFLNDLGKYEDPDDYL